VTEVTEEESVVSPKLVRVCGVDEIDSDSHMQVRVPDLGALAVYHVDGRFYVTADSCTHMQASLGEEGALEGHVIQCSWHNGKFDIRTGAVLGPPCPAPLKTYRVCVEGESIFVEAD
jgi:nitrite reductase/ring-hydroxylating ferredoxin subunit